MNPSHTVSPGVQVVTSRGVFLHRRLHSRESGLLHPDRSRSLLHAHGLPRLLGGRVRDPLPARPGEWQSPCVPMESSFRRADELHRFDTRGQSVQSVTSVNTWETTNICSVSLMFIIKICTEIRLLKGTDYIHLDSGTIQSFQACSCGRGQRGQRGQQGHVDRDEFENFTSTVTHQGLWFDWSGS